MQLGLKQSRRTHDNGIETFVSPIPPIERVVSLDNSKDTSKATRGWSKKGIGGSKYIGRSENPWVPVVMWWTLPDSPDGGLK